MPCCHKMPYPLPPLWVTPFMNDPLRNGFTLLFLRVLKHVENELKIYFYFLSFMFEVVSLEVL